MLCSFCSKSVTLAWHPVQVESGHLVVGCDRCVVVLGEADCAQRNTCGWHG